ncbi:hypothetical protein KIPB_015046, partial [Kipferlia bialata]|eukprot:g15046.t1
MPTPFHTVYPTPVVDESEIPHSDPLFIHAPGDGSVPCLSALADPFPGSM